MKRRFRFCIVPDGTAVQTDAVNAFGGSGTLYPVGWTNHGNMTLIRDNDNYYRYYFSGDELCLLRGPLTGGQFTTIGALEGLSENLFYYVISDGERIYTGNLDIISDGSAKNSFDPSAVQEYLQTLNADAEPQDLRYECINIWHIRDRYFIVMQDVSKALEDSYTLTADNYEVWTDDSGSILSAERVGNSRIYYCSDDKHEMYAIINGEHDLLDCPGYEQDDKPDPTAYGQIFDAYCVGDEEFYIADDNTLYTRVNGQPVLIDKELFSECLQLAPDRRFFFHSGDGIMKAEGLYLWEDGEKKLIYQPGSGKYVHIQGFEPNESGGYSIILFQLEQNEQEVSYVFLDSATYEIVKQLTVQLTE